MASKDWRALHSAEAQTLAANKRNKRLVKLLEKCVEVGRLPEDLKKQIGEELKKEN